MNKSVLFFLSEYIVSSRIEVVNFIITNSRSVSSVKHHLMLDGGWKLNFLVLMVKVIHDLLVYVNLFSIVKDLSVIIWSYEGDKSLFNFIIWISNFIHVNPKGNNTRSDDHQTKVQISDFSNDLVSLDIIIWQLLSLPRRRMVVKKIQRRILIWQIPQGSSFSLSENQSSYSISIFIWRQGMHVKWSI